MARMSSWISAWRAAQTTSSSVASGRPYRIFSRTLSANRKTSCWTIPMFWRRECCVIFRTQGCSKVLPKATVQVAEPIALSARICECNCCDTCCRIPECICKRYGGEFDTGCGNKSVFVTIGLFTIVQITRNVQMLIPAYDFCIPGKECVTTSDNPCELFRRIDFPTDEFFPPKVAENSNGCGCGCDQR